MPKIKTHSGAKKRFKLTKNGKVKRGHAFRSHLLNGHGKTRKLKRGLPQRHSLMPTRRIAGRTIKGMASVRLSCQGLGDRLSTSYT